MHHDEARLPLRVGTLPLKQAMIGDCVHPIAQLDCMGDIHHPWPHLQAPKSFSDCMHGYHSAQQSDAGLRTLRASALLYSLDLQAIVLSGTA